jgi:hypothetical protein
MLGRDVVAAIERDASAECTAYKVLNGISVVV